MVSTIWAKIAVMIAYQHGNARESMFLFGNNIYSIFTKDMTIGQIGEEDNRNKTIGDEKLILLIVLSSYCPILRRLPPFSIISSCARQAEDNTR